MLRAARIGCQTTPEEEHWNRSRSDFGTRVQNHDLGRITLTVLFIGGLLVASVWVLLPFVPAILWATTLVLATWPLMIWVQRHTGNRRIIAVLVMTVAVLLVVIVPLWLAIGTVISNIDVIGGLVRSILSMRIPPPPDWLAGFPLFGMPPQTRGQNSLRSEYSSWLLRLTPYAGALTNGSHPPPEAWAECLSNCCLPPRLPRLCIPAEKGPLPRSCFSAGLSDERGERAVRLAGQAIRSVALGVVVTALAQSVIGGIGLWAVGLPFATLLTALMFVLCLISSALLLCWFRQ